MVEDLLKYSFLDAIRRQYAKIAEELQGSGAPAADAFKFWLDPRLDQDLVCPPAQSVAAWITEGGFHPDQIGYDSRGGRWATLPIFKTGERGLNSVGSRYFPLTSSLVASVPGVCFASFFRLAPGADVLEHQHNRANLIFHLLLNNLDGARSTITCDGRTRELCQPGDWALFDYSLPHSSSNQASSSRVNLVIDFDPNVVAASLQNSS